MTVDQIISELSRLCGNSQTLYHAGSMSELENLSRLWKQILPVVQAFPYPWVCVESHIERRNKTDFFHAQWRNDVTHAFAGLYTQTAFVRVEEGENVYDAKYHFTFEIDGEYIQTEPMVSPKFALFGACLSHHGDVTLDVLLGINKQDLM